jgi:WD40 repeat-containing protein SMU1
MLQFLKENNLTNAFQTLQQESGVLYNTLDDKTSFTQAIKSGQWDIVLKQISQLTLHVRKRVDLYTQIILELAQLGEKTAARAILRDTDAMHWLKENMPEKYIFLETILSKSTFD